MSVVYHRPSPYDNWERFKLPWYQRIIVKLFLSKKEKEQLQRKIDKINATREKEHHEAVEETRKRLRPKPIPPRGGSGAIMPSNSNEYIVYERVLEGVTGDPSWPYAEYGYKRVGKFSSKNAISKGDDIVLSGRNFKVLRIEHTERGTNLIVDS